MKKIGGYILGIVGLLVLATSVKPFNEFVVKFLPFIEGISNLYLIIGGVVILLIAVFLLKGSRGQQKAEEVPIYEGKRVVGYRRG